MKQQQTPHLLPQKNVEAILWNALGMNTTTDKYVREIRTSSFFVLFLDGEKELHQHLKSIHKTIL